MINSILKWWYKNKIAYLERMINGHLIDDADICRDGKSADWWQGKAVGIETALQLLELKDLTNCTKPKRTFWTPWFN